MIKLQKITGFGSLFLCISFQLKGYIMQYVLCSNKEGMIDGKRRIPLGVGTKVIVYKSCYELSLCLNCTFGPQQNSKLNVCKTQKKWKKYDRFIKSEPKYPKSQILFCKKFPPQDFDRNKVMIEHNFHLLFPPLFTNRANIINIISHDGRLTIIYGRS